MPFEQGRPACHSSRGGRRRRSRRSGRADGLGLEIVVAGYVARQLRAGLLFLERPDHPLLDHLAAQRVDRMGDVGIEFGAALLVLGRAALFQPPAALVAVARAKMILAAALRTMGGQLAAGHGHERARGAFDDLQIADHKGVVERDRTKRLESLSRLIHELHANLGDFHGCSPCGLGTDSNGNFARQTPRRAPLPAIAVRSAAHGGHDGISPKYDVPLPLIPCPRQSSCENSSPQPPHPGRQRFGGRLQPIP